MKDLIAKLREPNQIGGYRVGGYLMPEAADAIEKLEAENAALKKDAANSKPNCRECTKWAKEQADNREWIDSVARGKVICKQLASEAMKGV